VTTLKSLVDPLAAHAGRCSKMSTMQMPSHQYDVYCAENVLADVSRRFSSHEEVWRYLDRVISDPWFESRWPHVIEVRVEKTSDSRFLGIASRKDLAIALHKNGLRLDVALHELAHLCAPEGAGHTASWRQVFLELVRREMGFFAYTDLVTEFNVRQLYT
jgi:putative metallohydrolase (TIGR04338 family)